MRDAELATVLLVKAFEEEDREGTLLTPADRETATREAARKPGVGAAGGEAVTSQAQQRLLVERARILFARLATRHPMIEGVRGFTRSFPWLEMVVVVAGLLAGIALSALDGPRRIEIFSRPLLALLAWNLAVFLFLALRAVRRRGRPASRGWLAGAIAGFPAMLATRAVARWRRFDNVLAKALERFSREWFEMARPLNAARATRAIHLAAAFAGAGLVAGLYMRGLVLDYRAGWESTFLTAEQARSLAAILYGLPAWLSGIALPDASRLEAIRWPRGEAAATWIHLIALAVLAFVVLPRVLLAFTATITAWRAASRMPLPPDLVPYFRASFSAVESIVPRTTALVFPYAHTLGGNALLRLVAWIEADAGGKVDVKALDPLPYGEEERYLATLAEQGTGAEVVVLPFGLASTPEDENHGAVIEGARDWLAAARPGGRLRVVIDEATFAERMAGAPQRIAERRAAWQAFVEKRGLRAEFVSLTP
ncbi:MAG TPA: DUF2868 domain-containing protein [Usitatibacter sp.]|nr:DUF2868 domain-containing protein [Usitatibacter sp.]